MKPTDKYFGLTADRARELFDYNQETGALTRRLALSSRAMAGDIAGYRTPFGYLTTTVAGRKYFVHRLVWIIYYGAWPSHEIDHIDGDRENNRISNLRDVEHKFNQQNQRKAQANNKLGVLGVRRSTGRKGADGTRKKGRTYKAAIRMLGKVRHLGVFDTSEEAHEAYLRAKREHHPGNTL